jgi:hypothetical protein
VRGAEHRGGQAETAVHAQRERVEPVVGQGVQADADQHLVGAGRGHADGGGEHPQMGPDGARGMARHIAEYDADLPRGHRDPAERTAAEEGDAAALLQLEHHVQGRGLAGAGCAEKSGDTAGRRLEGEVAHGGRTVPEGPARQADCLDHLSCPGGGGTALQ